MMLSHALALPKLLQRSKLQTSPKLQVDKTRQCQPASHTTTQLQGAGDNACLPACRVLLPSPGREGQRHQLTHITETHLKGTCCPQPKVESGSEDTPEEAGGAGPHRTLTSACSTHKQVVLGQKAGTPVEWQCGLVRTAEAEW